MRDLQGESFHSWKTDFTRNTFRRFLNLVEQIHCISNLSLELLEVVEITLNLVDREIDKHACDFESSMITDGLFHIPVYELTNNRFVVDIVRYNNGEEAETLEVVAVDYGIRVL